MEFTKTENTPITNLQSVASTSKLAVTQKATNTQREPLNLSSPSLVCFWFEFQIQSSTLSV